jgi:hypothetical protein
MFKVCTAQPVTSGCNLFNSPRGHRRVAEPDLEELMRDPMTQALMTADRVDRGQLHALLAQVRNNLR